jgi:hypothetical protein
VKLRKQHHPVGRIIDVRHVHASSSYTWEVLIKDGPYIDHILGWPLFHVRMIVEVGIWRVLYPCIGVRNDVRSL